MNIYDIADLRVALDCAERTMKFADQYISDNQDLPCDLYLQTKEDAVVAKSVYGEFITKFKENMPFYMAANLCECKSFYRKIISDFNGMMIHASAVVVDDKAYLFSAPSGTGKSTHTQKWLELFGEKAYILNDDKPAVRVLQNGIFAYGTPWSGKHDISVNKKVVVQGICFIERGKTNEIFIINGKEAAINLFHSSLRKLEGFEMVKLMDTIGKIVADVPIYLMRCTPTVEAAKLSYKVMSNVKDGEM